MSERSSAVVATLACLVAGACALPTLPAGGVRRAGPVVVVGVAPGGPGSGDQARARAARDLVARLRVAVERREHERGPVRPGLRVRDWDAVDRSLAASAVRLLETDPDRVRTSVAGDAFVASRIEPAAFDGAVERARAAGRAAPVRVAIVAPAVPGADDSGARWLYGLRDLYGSSLREALEAEGRIQVVDAREVFEALDGVGARGDRPISGDEVVRACERLHADALAHGRIDPTPDGLAVSVELLDGSDGRLLGRLDGCVRTAPEMLRLARRHALLWQSAVGVSAAE